MKLKKGDAVIRRGQTVAQKVEKLFEGAMHEDFEYGGRNNIYPSDAVCPRKCFITSNTTYSGTHAPRNKVMMSYGKMIESIIVEGLSRDGLKFVNNYVLSPDDYFYLSGKVDFIFEIDGAPWIIELKTTYPLPRKARDYQTFQAHCYSVYTCIPNVLMVYVTRITNQDLEYKAFDVSPDKQTLFEIATRLFYSQECMHDIYLPPIPKSFTKSKECKFCPFKSFCWDNVKNEMLDSVPEMSDKLHKQIFEEAKTKARKYMTKKVQNERRARFLDSMYSSDDLINEFN